MKKNVGSIIAAVVIGGLAASVAWADNTMQIIPFIKQSGGSGSGCPGSYVGYARMTNSTGGLWLIPPTNVVSGTFTNVSGVNGATCVSARNFMAWCGTNGVTFPATNSTSYELTFNIKAAPTPTNGQPISLQIIWNTQ